MNVQTSRLADLSQQLAVRALASIAAPSYGLGTKNKNWKMLRFGEIASSLVLLNMSPTGHVTEVLDRRGAPKGFVCVPIATEFKTDRRGKSYEVAHTTMVPIKLRKLSTGNRERSRAFAKMEVH
jgi:hypothetical protein